MRGRGGNVCMCERASLQIGALSEQACVDYTHRHTRNLQPLYNKDEKSKNLPVG